MIETIFRPRIQPLFNALGRSVCFASPTTITLFAFIFGAASGIAIAYQQYMLGILFLVFSGLCDILDGTVARLTNSSGKLGGYLDLCSDRMVEAAFICGLAYAQPTLLWPGMFFFISVMLHFTTFIAASELHENNRGKSIYYDVSLVERAEAFTFFILMALSPTYAAPLLWLLDGAILITALSRLLRIINYKTAK